MEKNRAKETKKETLKKRKTQKKKHLVREEEKLTTDRSRKNLNTFYDDDDDDIVRTIYIYIYILLSVCTLKLQYNINRMTLTREEVEKVCADVAEQVSSACREALRAAGLVADDVGDAELLGGGSYIPVLRRSVEGIFGYDEREIRGLPID